MFSQFAAQMSPKVRSQSSNASAKHGPTICAVRFRQVGEQFGLTPNAMFEFLTTDDMIDQITQIGP